MRMGEDTREDREIINSRLLGKNGLELPVHPGACYACPTNKEPEWNNAGIFKRHILAMHPTVSINELPPSHTLMVEANMQHQKSKKKMWLNFFTTLLCHSWATMTLNQRVVNHKEQKLIQY
jgi:hypothetical protein